MGLIVYTAEVFASALKLLLPPGRIWKLNPESNLSKVFLACADELERFSQRMADLLEESDPQTVGELLPDLERVLALPSTGTIEVRRARVVGRLILRQRVRPVDFKNALAPLLGQDPDDVVLIERGSAFAASVDDEREIYRFFIYRDPAEPGSYDIDGAQALIDGVEHSHTKGYVIESIDFRCDDPYSLCDRDLLGV